MKKIYEAPDLEIETYELDVSIANNCDTVVTMGPEAPGHSGSDVCDDYYEKAGEPMPTTAATFSLPKNVDFWEYCDCYYTASGTYFTS